MVSARRFLLISAMVFCLVIIDFDLHNFREAFLWRHGFSNVYGCDSGYAWWADDFAWISITRMIIHITI